MGLIKQKTLKTGATGEYWRILRGTIDTELRRVEIKIALYLNKAKRDQDPSAYFTESVLNVTWQGADFDAFEAALSGPGNLFGLAYAKLKIPAPKMERTYDADGRFVYDNNGNFVLAEVETNELAGATDEV